MAGEYSRESDEQRSGGLQADKAQQPQRDAGRSTSGEGRLFTPALLSEPALGERGNAGLRASTLRQGQGTHGNRAMQRFVQRLSASAAAEAETDDHIARQIEAKSGSGSPLDEGVRGRLEEGLGADLSGIRVHTDSEADRLAESMSAVAFTTGQDIFFRSGVFNPGSTEGLRLLAHEATHTVQQASGPVAGTPTEGGVAISNPSDSFEQAAERAADAVLQGEPAQAHGGAGPAGAPPAQRKLDGSGGAYVQRDWDDWLGPVAGAAAMPLLGPVAPIAGLASSPAVRDYVGSFWGMEPARPGEAPRGHAYSKVDHEMGNAEAGFSMLSGSGDIGGVPASVDWLYGGAKSGMFTNEDTGGTRVGTQLQAGVNKWNIGKGTPFSFDAGVGTASAEATVGNDGFSFGAQANAVEGALTMGNFGNTLANGEDRTNEEQVRLGLSAGVGAALRGHWGDSDKDGHREYGFGFDFEFVSADIKTEDPLRSALTYGMMANPFTAIPGIGMKAGLDYFAPDSNLTDSAIDYGSAAYDTASEYGSAAYDTASEYGSGLLDSVTSLDPSYLLM